ncbi:MAG: hypothetical protein IJL25_11325, partial [Clostridia bacterium]|nr:hypothetical protein [Clostridia bacterium]
LILAGILFALAVLAEPVLIAIYGVYCIAVLILYIRKQKKKQMQESAYLFCIRTWFWITLGAFIVFVAFLALLLCMGSLQELHKTLPYLFSGEDINLKTVSDLSSQLEAVQIFGPVSVICLLACAGGAVWYLISGKRDEKWKLALFLISVFFFCAGCIRAAAVFLNDRESHIWVRVLLYHEVPALLTAPVWCFLCGKKDSRVTGICTVGVLYSVLVDLSSNVMVGAGGRIAQTAGLLSLGMLLAEFRKKADAAPRKRNVFHNGEKRRKGTFYAGVSVLLSFLFLWNLPYFFMEGPWKPAERIYDDRETPLYACTLQRGPYKNIRTSKETADIYDTTLNDIDRIVQNANGAPLYIDVLSPYLYLYAGLPYGNFSAWDEEPLGRSLLYWQLFEEKKPGYIYIPGGAVGSLKLNYYPDALIEEEIEEISRVFAVEAVKGEGGYILRVLGDASEPSG